jgi:hypothetical protein
VARSSGEDPKQLNVRIAKSLNAEPGVFLNPEGWAAFTQELGSIEDDPGHIFNWIFSTLYWHHLTRFRLATVWLYVNALKLQHNFPVNRLSLSKLGDFLDSLSGSGPPIYDGQTFYAEGYS